VATGLAAYLFLSGDGLAGPGDSVSVQGTVSPLLPGSNEPQAADLRKRCVFLSTPGADLIVDGRTLARFDDSGKAIVNLDLGFYDVEVRDGAARIAGQRIDVRLEGENRFELHPPSLDEDTGDSEAGKPPERGRDGDERGDRREEGSERSHERRGTGEEGGSASPIPDNPFQ